MDTTVPNGTKHVWVLQYDHPQSMRVAENQRAVTAVWNSSLPRRTQLNHLEIWGGPVDSNHEAKWIWLSTATAPTRISQGGGFWKVWKFEKSCFFGVWNVSELKIGHRDAP